MIVYLLKDGPNNLISVNYQKQYHSFNTELIKINIFSLRAFHKKEYDIFMSNKELFLHWDLLKDII